MPYENNTGYPSTTQIIKPYLPTQYFTKEACVRGNAVHDWAEAYLKGAFPIPVRPEWQGYIDSLKPWIDENVVDILLVEERLVDTVLQYCGKADLFCTIKTRKGAGVIDWKTSESAADWWALQAVSYLDLGIKAGYPLEWCASVRPKKDGSGCLVKFYDPDEFPFLRNYFLSHLNAWRFHNK